MTEREVKAAVLRWFHTNGYKTVTDCVDDPLDDEFNLEECKTGRALSIDIVAKKRSSIWLVMVKGDHRDKNARKGYRIGFHNAVGQIFSRMTRFDSKIRYGIAIPFSLARSSRSNPGYRYVLDTYRQTAAFGACNLNLLLVDKDSNVSHISPRTNPADSALRSLDAQGRLF